IDLSKMEAKRAKHGDAFNIVVFGDPADPHDYYVMPFSAIGGLFAPTPSQLRSTDRPRWKVQIHDDELAVAGMDKRVNVAQFYADFAATQPDDVTRGGQGSTDATESDTQREGVVTQRRGQDRFKREVLTNFGHKCCLTGVVESDLLVASHIVPWSRRVPSRLDPANGLCLFVTHDKLFDRGYFTLSDDLTVVTTRLREGLSEHVVRLLDEIEGQRVNAPSCRPIRPEYLDFHRRHVFVESRQSAPSLTATT
ncbi:MAG: HNH endonuclease, partial [bacterium]